MNKDWRGNKDWRKSSRSTRCNNCVEVRGTLDALRDSKNPGGTHLSVAPSALAALVASVRA